MQGLADLASALSAWLVLLVRKDQQCCISQLLFVQHGGQFFGSGGESIDIGGVYDEDYRGGIGIVAPPVRANRGLTSEILVHVSSSYLDALATYPDVEVEVLVRDRFNVKAYCRYGRHYLADLYLLSAISFAMAGLARAHL